MENGNDDDVPSAATLPTGNLINGRGNDNGKDPKKTGRIIPSRRLRLGSIGNSSANRCECISRLLQQIAALIRHRTKTTGEEFDNALERCWAVLFNEFHLEPVHCTLEKCIAHCDDMIWYVPLVRVANGAYIGSETSHLQVFRRQSRNKPQVGDPSINWQETVCLNLILQQLDYFVTCAVCTKHSPSNLQIHRKTCQKVYPSPSRRRMDAKGECEEVTYPKIYFAIDSFDEVFTDMVVSQGECVCVELVCRDRYRNTEAVIFLGSIRYDVLKKLYDSRSSGAWNWSQRFISSATRQRHEFVKMRGPKGKGFAEMAVTRVASCGFETPMSESGFELGNGAGRFDLSLGSFSRRMSDLGSGEGGGGRLFSRLLYGAGGRSQRCAATPGGPPPSVTPTLYGSSVGGQRAASRWYSGESTMDQEGGELEGTTTDAQTLANSGSGSGFRTPGSWSMRGIGQALQFLRDRKEGEGANAEPQLNAFLTYITLPWNSILEDILCPNSRKSILTFDLQLLQNR